MTLPEQASETGKRFQRELHTLIAHYVTGADDLTQASVGAVLLAEAIRAAIDMGMTLDTTLLAIRAMYAIREAQVKPP